ncbi:hypothetical protein D9M71_813080 [compost metagenome]
MCGDHATLADDLQPVGTDPQVHHLVGILVRHRVLVSLVFDVIVGAHAYLIAPLMKVVASLWQGSECGQVELLEAR